MRPVRGLDRPIVQWAFVGLAVALVLTGGGLATRVLRSRPIEEQLRVDRLNADLRARELEIVLRRERAAREALSIEVGRLRRRESDASALPTLTLEPLVHRGAAPPRATMAVPAAGDVIQLRLVFPRAVRGPCTVSLRRWSSGESVWARSGLGQTPFNGRSGVVALLTGDVLTAGSYEILVTEATGAGAMADVAAYELTIGPVPAGEAKRP